MDALKACEDLPNRLLSSYNPPPTRGKYFRGGESGDWPLSGRFACVRKCACTPVRVVSADHSVCRLRNADNVCSATVDAYAVLILDKLNAG